MTGGVYYRDSGQLELTLGHLHPQETLDLLTPLVPWCWPQPPRHHSYYHIITNTINITQPQPVGQRNYERNVAILAFSN